MAMICDTFRVRQVAKLLLLLSLQAHTHQRPSYASCFIFCFVLCHIQMAF